MDIWKGSVTVPFVQDTTKTLNDLSFSTQLKPPTPTSVLKHLNKNLSKSTFSFLRFVPPSSVPFYLAAGPSLQVTTTSPATDAFLRTFFRSALPKLDPDYEEGTVVQSQISILLKVIQPHSEDAQLEVPEADWGITEVLIYGVVSYKAPTPEPAPVAVRPTPPHSSPGPPVENEETITYHVLPLSTRHNLHIARAARADGPASRPARAKTPPQDLAGSFLAPNPQDTLNPTISATARKRRADVLDKAVERKTKKPKMTETAPAPLTLLGSRAVNARRSQRDVSPTPMPRQPSILKRESSVSHLRREPSVSHLRRESSEYFDRRETSVSFSRPQSSAGIQPQSAGLGPVAIKPDPDPAAKRLIELTIVDEMKAAGVKDYRRVENSDEFYKKEYKGIYYHTYRTAVFALRDGNFNPIKVRAVVRRLVETFTGIGLGLDEDESRMLEGGDGPRVSRKALKKESVVIKLEDEEDPLLLKEEPDEADPEAKGTEEDPLMLTEGSDEADPEVKGNEVALIT
ncbi:hypothetical protein EDC01DRAFT_645647 [Geopyxis carbonaria]|nr:hypothetical protein EDC01DRAFT_645647 [Geopyxis carbonaria]